MSTATMNAMKTVKIIFLLCLLESVVAQSHSQKSEDDDILLDISRLYEEPENYVHPHDMFADLVQESKPSLWKEQQKMAVMKNHEEIPGKEKSGGCVELKPSSDIRSLELEQDVEECQRQLAVLKEKIVNEQKISVNLQKKLLKEKDVDVELFYSRIVQYLSSLLNLQEVEEVLNSGSSAVVRQLSVTVNPEHMAAVHQYLQRKDNIQQIDDFLHSFKLEEPSVNEEIFLSIRDYVHLVGSSVKNLDVWLHLLAFILVLMGIWALALFIQDIRRQLRWGRVMAMMLVVAFTISFLWHWRHMYKVGESRRHAHLVKRGFDVPKECEPGGKSTDYGIVSWVRRTVFGGPDVCERYFEEVMLDPVDEITPGMVFAETVAKMIFQPLQHLGTESAHFLSNFYDNIPVMWHIHATVLFIVLFVIVLFAFCGYGIDFPLWMGGIRPIFRPESQRTGEESPSLQQLAAEWDAFLRESQTTLRDITRAAISESQSTVHLSQGLAAEWDAFLRESQTMLRDITRAAISESQSTVHLSQGAIVQPVSLISSHIMEQQLQQLIKQRYASQLMNSQTQGDSEALPSAQQSVLEPLPKQDNSSAVRPSAPLRTLRSSESSLGKEKVDGIDAEHLSEKSSVQNKALKSQGLHADIDAAHPRLTGISRAAKTVECSKNNQGDGSSPSVEARANSSTCPSHRMESVSSQVNEQRVSEGTGQEIASGVTPTGTLRSKSSGTDRSEQFVEEVRSILEESLNSSSHSQHMDDSDIKSEDSGLHHLQRRHNKAGGNAEGSSGEESENSISSTDFLSRVKRLMTP